MSDPGAVSSVRRAGVLSVVEAQARDIQAVEARGSQLHRPVRLARKAMDGRRARSSANWSFLCESWTGVLLPRT